MRLKLPELSLVLLVGASGAGKSTFVKKHFGPYEVVSSDECRGIVSNDENNLAASADAFDLLRYTIGKRLQNGLLTVVDATNVQPESRKSLIELARQYHALPVAIVFRVPVEVCLERNEARSDRNIRPRVIAHQARQLARSIKHLKREGFRQVHVLTSPEEVEGIDREKLYSNKRGICGPFDIIGDVHGCYDETIELLGKLGYEVGEDEVTHPDNRKVLFLGDLVDRGPDSLAILKLVMRMVESGVALCVAGNHDVKLHKKLQGKPVVMQHGLAETVEQLQGEGGEFFSMLKKFLYSLTSHYVLDDGKLVVAHAGIREEMQGRGSPAVRSFCLYGETTGEIDEFGFPVRYEWASEYRGDARVVYGHTPIPEPQWLNKTINIDTGCVFGGRLTALRYPEQELVSVKAKQTYCASTPMQRPSPNECDDLLSIEDILGKRIIETRLKGKITVREENAIAAIEVMGRFAVHPKWLIYLPPTMSPCQASDEPYFLEHPQEAIAHYASRGVERIICQEKHMGSRAVFVLCKDNTVPFTRFGLQTDALGCCYTRTGRNFFTDPQLEKQLIDRMVQALTKSGFWEKYQTDWVCLDVEVMPWSAKAQTLLTTQYAAVGSAATQALTEAEAALQQAAERDIQEARDAACRVRSRKERMGKFIDAYRAYCWNVSSIEDYKIAPFHILATENAVHVDKNHEWHMEEIREICLADPNILQMTPYKIVETNNPQSCEEATNWWLELTGKGGEGMVVKPHDFIARGDRGGILQPAIKCRGTEYLRIIYGPEYDLPHNLATLKRRGLGRKRSLALREFALGVESLERFVQREPLRRVHETVFGILALESEEVDPRL